MSTCTGDILPLPKDILVGLKAFSGGVQLAFLLASISLFTVLRGPKQCSPVGKISVSQSGLKVIVCFASQITAAVMSLDVGWKDHGSPLSVLIRAINEIAGVLSLAVLCLFSRHPKNWFISSAAVVYASSFYFIRTSGRRNLGEDALCVRTSALAVIAVAFLFVSTDKRGLTTEQLGVSGHLLGLLVFHFALFWLQSSGIVPEEVATLCYSLVAGWVRYNVTVLSCRGDDTAVILATARPCDDSAVPIRQRPKLPALVIDEPHEDNEEDEEDTEVHELATARSSVHKELNKFQLVHRADESELFKHMHSESVDMFEGREASSRRKLLRYVFHEMRAPLNAISMAVELLTNQYKTGATPKSRKADLETLQMIEEASLTMERTLKDSMTLQRIEEGLLVPQVKIFSVHEMCDDIHDALMLVLRSSSVRFAYSVDPAVPVQLVGDHFRLRHVVAHVVSNGIKYSRPGDVVRMRVTLGPRTQAFSCDEDEGGGVGHEVEGADGERISLTVKASENVVFSISDQGVGMSAELQASDIFKPFSTLKTDELKNFRGSGLGLAICKKIMHFLQGAISYNSVPNEGTTFTVTYPLTRLDKNSMDEYDSDCDESGPATVGTYSGSFYSPTCTPETTRRKIALTRAKSFRGQRLFNIMQTPSSVFECPTPKSSVPSPMRSEDPSDHQEIQHTQSDHRLASIDEADCEYSPRPGDPDSPASSSNPPSPERVSLVEPPPRRPSFQGSPRFATKRLSARTLSINTHTGSLVDRESNYNSVASSFRSDAAPELLANTERSVSSDGESDHPVSRHNSEYAALTEKNVNLHILRSASTDVACVLQVQGAPPRARVSSGRLPLVEMLSACKVLVVDDAASNRKLLSLLLRRAGFGSVDLVEDGQAAVDYCKALKKEDQPGIIFMDNTMPNLTGIEASKVIRAAGYQHLIIGVTGNSLEDELDEFIAAGADLVIVKPLKNQSLEMLLGFVQAHGFDSAHGYRIDQVGKEFTWVPRSPPEAYREN